MRWVIAEMAGGKSSKLRTADDAAAPIGAHVTKAVLDAPQPHRLWIAANEIGDLLQGQARIEQLGNKRAQLGDFLFETVNAASKQCGAGHVSFRASWRSAARARISPV
jgi:hypothetical protein